MRVFFLNLMLAVGLAGCGPPLGRGKVAFSPDGHHALLAVYRHRSGIYRMNMNWTNPVRLTTHDNDSFPAYSPNGQEVIFVRNYDVYIMNADGTNQTQLTEGLAEDRAPVFSPDGQRIYFSRSTDKPRHGPDMAIYSIMSDGSSVQRISQNDYLSYGNEFSTSPDGKHLVMAGAKSIEELWREPPVLPLISLETGKEVRLIELQPRIEQYLSPTVVLQSTVIESPTYSPDGKAILFVAYAKLKNRAGHWIDDSKPATFH